MIFGNRLLILQLPKIKTQGEYWEMFGRKSKAHGRGRKMYLDEKKTLEQKLTENLQELEKNPNAEVLPITEGYLTFQAEGEAGLKEFLKMQKAKAEAAKLAGEKPQ